MVEQKNSKIWMITTTLFFMIASVLLPSCAVINKNINADDIRIDNHIIDCIEIVPIALIEKKKALYLNAALKKKKSSGYCGCLSALISYKVVGINDCAGTKVTSSVFSPLNIDHFEFLIGGVSQSECRNVKLIIFCKYPD